MISLVSALRRFFRADAAHPKSELLRPRHVPTVETLEDRTAPAVLQGVVFNDADGDGVRQASESGLAGWTTFLDHNGNGVLDGETTTAASTGGPIPISDFNTTSWAINVDDFFGFIADVNVRLNVQHTWVADLDVFLTSPNGTRVELFTDIGGGGDNLTNTILDDDALTEITSAVAPATGQFRPEGSLAAFDGEDPIGLWTLEITDDEGGDTGSLLDWSLSITGEDEPSAVSAADGSFSFNNLSAGTYTLRQIGQPDWIQTAPAGDGSHSVVLAAGETIAGLDFGNQFFSTDGEIRGTVWNDSNGDGIRNAGEAGIQSREVYLDLNGNGLHDGANSQFVAADVPQAVLDFALMTSEISVSGFGTVADVNVTLDVTHTWDGDLTVHLVSPSGTRVQLFSNVGGSGNHFTDTTLDDEASIAITSSGAPFTGSFQPGGSLADFDGEIADGVWTLEILDTAGGDTGSLNAWSLELSGANEPSTITDANGNYAFTSVEPGTYTVRQIAVPDWQTTFPATEVHDVNVGQAEVVENVDFGSVFESSVGEIHGTVWNDENGDGQIDAQENGLPGRQVYLDLNDNGVLDSGLQSFASSGSQAIIDQQTITSQIVISGLSNPIEDVNVALNISHTWDADLEVFLVSPSGTRVELFTDVGGGADNFTGTILDDEAPVAITSGAAPFAGSYRPEGLLSTFDGEDGNGDWTLEITDDEGGDTGTLHDWSLIVENPSETAVLTDANGDYEFADVNPGDYTIRQILPDDWTQTLPAANGGHIVSISAGQTITDQNFGAQFTATTGEIHGLLFNDGNGDGVQDPGEGGLAGWTVYLDENNNGQLDHEVVVVNSGDLHAPLPDLTTSTSVITVGGFVGPITDLNITLNIEHTYDADLDIFLISPNGTRVELFTDIGGAGDNFFDTTLDDEANSPIADGLPPFITSWQPEGNLSDFDGEDANGDWTLEITDDEGGDVGELLDWSMRISGQGERLTTTDASGNYSFTDLDPDTYRVRSILKPLWVHTSPDASGEQVVPLNAGDVLLNVNLGNQNTQPSQQLLPDLFVWASAEEGYMYDWVLDTTSQPGRTLLRFSTAVANIGDGNLEVHGGAVHPDDTQDVFQRIYDSDGNFTDRLAGTFVFHDEHSHTHFEDYALYNLREVTTGNGVGDVIATGDKVSFCLLDSVAYDTSLPGASGAPHYITCDVFQGISVGWADVYGHNLPDQWIDITGVPDGTYWLEIVADPENRLVEADETNNVTRIQVTISTS